MFNLELRLRRLRKSPKSPDFKKLHQLIWCYRFKDYDFNEYLSVSETTIEVYNQPFYHLRLPSFFKFN